jgi:outer membrane protein OmpA-like peptidoglycan-associated protein
MKKIILLLSLGLFGLLHMPASAQNRGIGLHFGAYDFFGPQTGNYLTSDRYTYEYNEGRKLYDTAHHAKFYWKPMVKGTYWFQITDMFDVNLGLSLANLEYPASNDDTAFVHRNRYNVSGEKREKFLTEFDVRFNYSILPRDRWIASPYLFAGINASYHDIFFGVDIPLGVGLNIGLTKARDLSLNLESAYKIKATDHDVNHLQHSIGFVYWFKPGYRPPAASGAAADLSALTQPQDSDNDGIEDVEDECPTIAGMAQFNGCPDTDGDGISDKDDSCPLVAGIAQYNGCPDTDGDGIADNTDKCPYVAGSASHEGCPVPDQDNDGFDDDVDKCPDVYSKTNMGCPEIRKEIITQVEKAAKAIFFETGKSTIKPSSFKSLDAVVAILKADETLYADIEGHTDNVQPKTYTNMELSQKRAEAVRDYFISKGVDGERLTAQGFGETQPVADNGTAAGKAQNRRTVIQLRNYRK